MPRACPIPRCWRCAPGFFNGRIEDQEEDIRESTEPNSIVELYCDAWNRGDLDAIFALFAEDARYEGNSTHLIGRDAIRQMYERTFASGEAKELIAQPMEQHASSCSVGIYRHGECVAVKQFEITDGFIILQSMRG